ncbi:MAG: hypothetical protein OCD76_25465 [Reichenbachiella sp.]
MNKIGIIIPYFGQWPSYFDIFLTSCSYNNNFIDYLFFTDIDIPKVTPSNVTFHDFTLDDFNRLAQKKIDPSINVTSPYKLCDFKPTYGHLFTEYLEDYTYWGHGDEDLILGDVSKFLAPKLAKYPDIISVRKNWVSGSFCLFKNTPRVNLLFSKSNHCPKIFSENSYSAFDECTRLFDKLRLGEDILDIDPNQSMTFLIRQAEEKRTLSIDFTDLIKESIGKGESITFNKGKLVVDGKKEIFAYHYITEKNSLKFNFPNWNSTPEIFHIDDTGFYTDGEWSNSTMKQQILSKRKRQIPRKKIKSFYKRVITKIASYLP